MSRSKSWGGLVGFFESKVLENDRKYSILKTSEIKAIMFRFNM